MILKVSQMIQKGVGLILRLAEVRKARGFTQKSLSALSGVSRISIARYETGKASPSVRMLQRIADALKVPIGELVDKKAG